MSSTTGGTKPITLKKKIQNNLKQLMQNREFRDLLKNDLKTELNIGLKTAIGIKTGRIDLLVIQDTQITIIDYKSDVTPSETLDLVPLQYIEQLNFYRNVIKEIYKNHRITLKILWLENGRFMNL